MTYRTGRKMAIYDIGPFHGEGRTKKEAQERAEELAGQAGKRLEVGFWVMRGPPGSGIRCIVVAPAIFSWGYCLLRDDEMDKGLMTIGLPDEATALRDAVLHAVDIEQEDAGIPAIMEWAQALYKRHRGIGFPDPQDIEKKVRDRTRFNHLYREGREKGLDDQQAHRYACEGP